jgi:hypothetical protein
MAANSLIISLLHRAFTLAISIYAIEKHVVDMWVLFSVLRDFVKKTIQVHNYIFGRYFICL